MLGETRTALLVVLGAVALVLLIACGIYCQPAPGSSP